MPFALLIFGALLLVAGVRGTASQLYGLLKGDFVEGFASTSFVAWVVAILAIGSVGYVKKLQPISDAFLLLLVVVLALVKGKGFFDPVNGFFAQVMHPARMNNTASSNTVNPVPSFVDTQAQQQQFINSLSGVTNSLTLGNSTINYNYPAYAAGADPTVPSDPFAGGGYAYPAYGITGSSGVKPSPVP